MNKSAIVLLTLLLSSAVGFKAPPPTTTPSMYEQLHSYIFPPPQTPSVCHQIVDYIFAKERSTLTLLDQVYSYLYPPKAETCFELFQSRMTEKWSEEKIKLDENTERAITCSIGSIIFPVNESYPDLISFYDCITYSDMALYHSKQNGRNRATHIDLNYAMLADCDSDSLKLNLSQYKFSLNDPIFIKTIIE